MAKLPTLRPSLPALDACRARPAPSARMTGRKLQDRRLRIWAARPHCAGCGRLTIFPHGFELDHKVPLFQGGQDTDANCQVLCVHYDALGHKAGCHAEKTARDLGG